MRDEIVIDTYMDRQINREYVNIYRYTLAIKLTSV